MNVKPLICHSTEPLRDEIQRQLADADEAGWVDFGVLLAECRALPWYERAWYWLRRLEPLWWLRYRTTHRYHIVKTGLRPNYYDKDTLMLHACFNLLVQFVERECGGVIGLQQQTKYRGHHGERAAECLALYLWWTATRPLRGDEDYDMEAVYDAQDDEMLARLVKIRRWLWT